MNTETISIAIGVIGLLFGMYAYFTSGILKDKSEIIEHRIRIIELERRVHRLEKIDDDE